VGEYWTAGREKKGVSTAGREKGGSTAALLGGRGLRCRVREVDDGFAAGWDVGGCAPGWARIGLLGARRVGGRHGEDYAAG